MLIFTVMLAAQNRTPSFFGVGIWSWLLCDKVLPLCGRGHRSWRGVQQAAGCRVSSVCCALEAEQAIEPRVRCLHFSAPSSGSLSTQSRWGCIAECDCAASRPTRAQATNISFVQGAQCAGRSCCSPCSGSTSSQQRLWKQRRAMIPCGTRRSRTCQPFPFWQAGSLRL